MYARLIITTCIGLLTSRFMLQALGASDYGLNAVVGGLIGILNVLSTAMHTTTRRFINVEMGKPNGNLNRIFNISRLLHIGFAVLIFIVAETVGMWYIYNYLQVAPGKFEDAVFVFQLSTISAAIGITNVPYQALMEAYEKFAQIAIVDIFNALAKLIFFIALLTYEGNALRLCSIGMSCLTLVWLFFYNIACFAQWKDVVKYRFYSEWKQYRELLFFNNYVAMGATAYLCRSQGSTLLINYFFGTIVNAAFAIGYMIENYCIMFVNNIGLAAGPQITRNYADNQERSYYLTTTLTRYSTYLILLLVVPMSIELDFILKIWLKEVPEGTQIICHLTLISALLRVLFGGTSKIIHASGKIKWFQIVGSIIEIGCLPVTYILFRMGLPAYMIIVAFILSSCINRVVDFVLLKYILKFPVWRFIREVYGYTFRVLLPLALLTWGYSSIAINSLLGHMFGVIAGLFMTVITVYTLGLQQEERLKINNITLKLIHRK